MNGSTDDDYLPRRLEREQARVAVLENLIEEKTRALFIANEALRRHNDHLEVEVASRTSALQKAMTAAEAAGVAKMAFWRR